MSEYTHPLEERKGKRYDGYTGKYVETTDDKSEYVETTTEPSTESLGSVRKLTQAVYGDYAPTRFEYFVGLALQGLVTGRAERDLKTAVRKALDLAREVEELLDKKEG